MQEACSDFRRRVQTGDEVANRHYQKVRLVVLPLDALSLARRLSRCKGEVKTSSNRTAHQSRYLASIYRELILLADRYQRFDCARPVSSSQLGRG